MNSATEAIHIIEHAIVLQVREKDEDCAFLAFNSYSAVVTDSYVLRSETDVAGYHHSYAA